MTFETNVFVNCPFDDAYKPLLRPLLFTLLFLGLKPRIATERVDTGEQRITKIIGLIHESKYAIHDLSRIKAQKKGEMFRLNMPFELGIDVGCRQFGAPPLDSKRFLVLAAERYEYQAAISDISGSDIGVHNNDANQVVKVVRAWIANQTGISVGPAAIWAAFNDCMAKLSDDFEAEGFDLSDIKDLPVPELIKYMERWILIHNAKKAILSVGASGKHKGTSGDRIFESLSSWRMS
ncbi:hypothetical protein [Massilia yuzhufengensis]|uniref:Uncharacterized protein n=1 Tax=Massilia yuzhufengensis TaxID=1164594 RepID=A0A1I1TLZ0_9BURK|nr:hypothetical protein [Massilia yuzhufengensis]SFD59662.1 hypothetical protein SAMN05216204_12956 [Massilia yuzhufengensis]